MRRARTRLRLGIGFFVLALAVPSLLLALKAMDQIKWEAFRQQQIAAEELATRIDTALAALVRAEDARPAEDYDFLVDKGGSGDLYTRRSPLAELTATSQIPGLMGWFQVAADGQFSSPLVPGPGIAPARFGVNPAELETRLGQARRIEETLVGNRLVERGQPEEITAGLRATSRWGEDADTLARLSGATGSNQGEDTEAASSESDVAGSSTVASAASPRTEPLGRLSQAAFERLAAPKPVQDLTSEKAKSSGLQRVDEIKLDAKLAERSRRELEEPPALPASSPAPPSAPPPARRGVETHASPEKVARPSSVQLFATAVEPFDLGRLDSGHLLLFRSVWRKGQRTIQGALIDQAAFLDTLVGNVFATTALARSADLTAAYRGAVLASFRADAGDYRLASAPLSGALLYRTRLREPFGGLELIFSVNRLPNPPGSAVIGWTAGALALVLLAGGWLMYRLGLGQIALVRQQQDFVSAISHELKTPLTSIRMYAEMLRGGIAAEERKPTYYRFIHEESERLSRLIANVLQLARIGRDALVLEPRPIAIQELMAMVRERIGSQIEGAGFELEMGCGSDAWIEADPDAFVQILINLVDNALKFSGGSYPRRIQIGCKEIGDAWLRISVRDFGPGVPRDQRKQIFQLFYRGPEASAHAVPGTGIGLALVRRLTEAQQGRVETVNRSPGAEFRVEFPLTPSVADQPPR